MLPLFISTNFKSSSYNFTYLHYEMGDTNFRDLWSMITWIHALQARYPNLLILAKLARECVLCFYSDV